MRIELLTMHVRLVSVQRETNEINGEGRLVDGRLEGEGVGAKGLEGAAHGAAEVWTRWQGHGCTVPAVSQRRSGGGPSVRLPLQNRTR